MRIHLLKNIKYTAYFMVVLWVFSSCATIFGGRKNTINVNAGSPENAQVYLDGKYLGEAPFKMKVSKYDLQEGSLIEIKKEDYKTQTHEVGRNPNVLYVIADIFGGVIPLFVDVALGNIYRPNTQNMEYELKAINTKERATLDNHNPQNPK